MNIAPAQWGDVCIILLSLLVQGIPFLLLGALLGGFVSAWTPFSTLLRHWPRNPLLAALMGAVSALFIPACDCAAVPVVRRLIRKGIPLSASIAYLFAAPVFNPICMISTFLAFRFGSPWQMLALREGGGLLLAVALGVLAARVPPAFLLKSSVLTSSASGPEPMPWMEIPRGNTAAPRQWAPILAAALVDFLNVSTLFVLGALVSGLLQTFLPLEKLAGFRSAGLQVPGAMFMAFLLSQCSAADAFVVNGFGALGLAGQLAFLWLGPIYNLRVLFLYRSIFQYRAILFLGAASTLLIFVMTIVLIKCGISR
jgi:uncharacterized membrane protein YraQ (UPF0718 family)